MFGVLHQCVHTLISVILNKIVERLSEGLKDQTHVVSLAVCVDKLFFEMYDAMI